MPRLDRFVHAQDDPDYGWKAALDELRAGRKRGHWIWYVFPQLAGLGMSANAIRFAIAGRDEAVEYLSDPVLRSRLLRAIDAVAGQLRGGASLVTLMGSRIDALKLVSSLTLFACVARSMEDRAPELELSRLVHVADEALVAADRQGFPRCEYTLAHLRATR